jgi:hypothetical protein
MIPIDQEGGGYLSTRVRDSKSELTRFCKRPAEKNISRRRFQKPFIEFPFEIFTNKIPTAQFP